VPGTESCNGVDDDCNGQIDEGEDLPSCTVFYRDGDGDTFGTLAVHKCLCAPDAAGKFTSLSSTDCCDTDAKAYLGQAAYSTTPRATCGGFDFNCNGTDDKQPFAAGQCRCSNFLCTGCTFLAGWDGNAPNCGEPGIWISGCNLAWPSCNATRTTVAQPCR
jgi:hypothetical protein